MTHFRADVKVAHQIPAKCMALHSKLLQTFTRITTAAMAAVAAAVVVAVAAATAAGKVLH